MGNSDVAVMDALLRGAQAEGDLDPALVAATTRSWSAARVHWEASRIAPVPIEVWALVVGRSLRERGREQWIPAVDGLHANDLYLALACSAGDEAALRRLDEHVQKAASLVASRMREDVVDVAQMIRLRVLTPGADGDLRIRKFSGRGSVESWLRIVGTRALLNERRKEGPVAPDPGDFADPVTTTTPELQLVRAESKELFEAALHTAFGRLEPAERELLGKALVEGQTVTELGRSLGVHTATAARRLVRARERLLEVFNEELRRHVEDTAEAQQLLAILRSRASVDDGEFLAEGS